MGKIFEKFIGRSSEFTVPKQYPETEENRAFITEAEQATAQLIGRSSLKSPRPFWRRKGILISASPHHYEGGFPAESLEAAGASVADMLAVAEENDFSKQSLEEE